MSKIIDFNEALKVKQAFEDEEFVAAMMFLWEIVKDEDPNMIYEIFDSMKEEKSDRFHELVEPLIEKFVEKELLNFPFI